MPEIAEVALTAQILNNNLKGRILTQISFLTGKYNRNPPENYQLTVNDLPMKIASVNSKGKFMWFKLTSKQATWYLWNTFGMSGVWTNDIGTHTRMELKFSDKTSIFFNDMRNFGTVKFSNDESELVEKLEILSPDFLKDSDFDINRVVKYKTPIVKILMDQKKLGSGIGNYLVAEILYRAKISPYKLGCSFTKADIANLTYWIKYVVKLSYCANNTGYMPNLQKFGPIEKINYHPDIVINEPEFQFLVYKRKTDPNKNPVVGDKIVKSGSKWRTTWWVPVVQTTV